METLEGDYFPEDEQFSQIPGNNRVPANEFRTKKEGGTIRKKIQTIDNVQRTLIKCQESELKDLLTDFVNFHLVMVFDVNAEDRYRAENAAHPYLRALDRITEINESLMSHLKKTMCLTTTFLQAASRHCSTWESRKRGHTEFNAKLRRKFFDPIRIADCQMCSYVSYFHVYFKGPSYDRKTLKDHEISNEYPEEEVFDVCADHRLVMNCYFALFHMRWNILRNCEYRIHSLFSRNRGMSS
uniref:Ras-GEF domain-containing protein n=1 Tax=Steinernema glaseri TaxID=37863 RepID=A0A1I7ZRT8_9BILA